MRYYDKISEGYDELYGDEQKNKIHLLKKMVKKYGIIPGRVLDIGCGTFISRSFFKDIIGIDSSFGMINKGKGNLVVGCAEKLPFKEDSFGLVISVSSVHHFNLDRAINEMLRVGKYFGISILKSANDFEDIYNKFRREFRIIDEIEEDKDRILLLKRK